MIDYPALDNDTLVNLLFTEEDRLPRQAVDEFVRRGERMIEPLSKIVVEETNWTKDRPEFWAPIHAVFILGAIGAQEAIAPLVTAAKWSDKYDVDWVLEAFPAIFGKIGTPALEQLRQCAQDKELRWFVRAIVLSGLASVTLKNPEVADDVFSFINSFFTNVQEDMDFRIQAANILLDFVLSEYKKSLLAFCAEERRYSETDPFPMVSYDEEDVETAFSENKKHIDYYTRNWLSFYDEDQIRSRQERWEKEKGALTKAEKNEYEEDEILHPLTEAAPKVGRNAPCPCGSGKKYKKCCMQNKLF